MTHDYFLQHIPILSINRTSSMQHNLSYMLFQTTFNTISSMTRVVGCLYRSIDNGRTIWHIDFANLSLYGHMKWEQNITLLHYTFLHLTYELEASHYTLTLQFLHITSGVYPSNINTIIMSLLLCKESTS